MEFGQNQRLYPFVRGSTIHKYNLKDPINLNSAFRLGFIIVLYIIIKGISFDGGSGGAFTYFNLTMHEIL